MKIHQVERSKTFFNTEFIEEYYNGTKLLPFYTHKPSIESIKDAIANRAQFSNNQRLQLHEVLENQYKKAQLNIKGSPVKSNIDLLLKENTYTVTTGQQIHIGLGPMYVLYKIWNAIAIAKELQTQFPDSNFVPVFWMATEDHDLEEIKDIEVFGQSFTWETSQTGAVGRMHCKGIVDLFTSIENKVRPDAQMLDFIAVCKKAYEQPNLSLATREIIHTYFSEHGLIVLDADNEGLKQHMRSLALDELNQVNAPIFKETGKALHAIGFKEQVFPRQCNLFLIKEDERIRLNAGDADYQHINKNDLEDFVDQNLGNISPNALLRPLYQELILPNVVYVGGGAELKYWAQLKGVFNRYNQQLPLLHLRTNCLVVNHKKWETSKELDLPDLFLTEEDFILKNSAESKNIANALAAQRTEVSKQLELYKSLFKENLPGFSMDSKVEKVDKTIASWETLEERFLLSSESHNTTLKNGLKLIKNEFKTNPPKERSSHIISNLSVLKQGVEGMISHFGLKNSQIVYVLVV